MNSEHQLYLKKKFFPGCILSEFSAYEIEILEKYGSWMDALMRGYIEPETNMQKMFVACCRGEKKVESEYEKLWVKYRLQVLYEHNVKLEDDLVNGRGLYKNVRDQYELLARMGHKLSIRWLEKEGDWKEDLSNEKNGKSISPIYGYTGFLTHCVSGSYGSKYDCGHNPVD